MFKKKKDSIDYEKLNEGINIGVSLLKIALVFTIAAVVFIISKLLIDWKIFPIIKTFLSILSPLFIGIVLAWLFDPAVTKLQKNGINRVLGSIFVYVVFIFFIFVLGKIMIPTISNQLQDLGKSVPTFINFIKDNLDSFFNYLNNLGDFDFTSIEMNLYSGINEFAEGITVNLPGHIMGFISILISGGINLILGLFVGLYMLFDFDSVKKHLYSLIPKNIKKDTFTLCDRLNSTLKSYVRGTLLIMLILFICQSLAFTISGLKAPLVFGLFCAVTDIIPYVGPYIGGIPAIIVGFSINSTVGIFTLIAVVLCQALENYFLQPIVMGKTMRLHPVTIMIGLLVFNHFFGIPGMVLATPIISIAKTIFNFFDEKYHFMSRIRSN